MRIPEHKIDQREDIGKYGIRFLSDDRLLGKVQQIARGKASYMLRAYETADEAATDAKTVEAGTFAACEAVLLVGEISNVEAHIESMIRHKIKNGAKVNLCNFNRQLRELGCGVGQRRTIRQRVTDGVSEAKAAKLNETD